MDRKDLDVTLYLVTDSTYHTEESLLHTVEEACKGGVTLVQLREKNTGGREYLDKAFKVFGYSGCCGQEADGAE